MQEFYGVRNSAGDPSEWGIIRMTEGVASDPRQLFPLQAQQPRVAYELTTLCLECRQA